MAWSREEFLAILKTSIAEQLLNDKEIAAYVTNWKEEHKAALLHANGITAETLLQDAQPLLQLVAAFGRKDLARLEELVNQDKLSVGARLDYLLPLYDENYHGGEDIFVASTKAMLGGNASKDVNLQIGNMMHKVGNDTGKPYSQNELEQLSQYVNNSFAIRKLFQAAPNKEIIQPTKKAVEYMIANAVSYRDTNDNPTIVFIPGAISVANYPVTKMIEDTITNGANINDVGFFGVPGIVWSIILGDVESVKKFLELGARVDLEDEMGNKHLAAWASTTHSAVNNDNTNYCERLLTILKNFSKQDILQSAANNFAMRPADYLDYGSRGEVFSQKLNIFQDNLQTSDETKRVVSQAKLTMSRM